MYKIPEGGGLVRVTKASTCSSLRAELLQVPIGTRSAQGVSVTMSAADLFSRWAPLVNKAVKLTLRDGSTICGELLLCDPVGATVALLSLPEDEPASERTTFLVPAHSIVTLAPEAGA